MATEVNIFPIEYVANGVSFVFSRFCSRSA